jgi:hypothetical protein
MEICNFRRTPMVGVPIAEVTNTLASRLRWVEKKLCWTSGHQNDLLEVGVP